MYCNTVALQCRAQKNDENSILGMIQQMGCLHLACEYALMETRQIFECLIVDGRWEHEAILANMTLIFQDTCVKQRN